jgi:hypothetical protein
LSAELDLLVQIRDELRSLPAAIAAAIERQHHVRRLSPTDEAELSALLPVIFGAIKSRPFLVRELFQHAGLNIAPAIALCNALKSTNPQKLGRLLSRACDINVGSYHVRKCGKSKRDGLVWAVECDDRSSQKHTKFALPRCVRF